MSVHNKCKAFSSDDQYTHKMISSTTKLKLRLLKGNQNTKNNQATLETHTQFFSFKPPNATRINRRRSSKSGGYYDVNADVETC